MSTDKLLQRLLVSLLGKRRRRLPILYRWNTHSPPCKGESLDEIVHGFITLLLYEPLALEMTQDALFPWGRRQSGTAIPFTWLTRDELESIKRVHAYRSELFRSDRRQRDGSFVLSDYNPMTPPLELSIQHRRELVRDFVGICWIHRKENALIHHALLNSVLKLVHYSTVDSFIVPLIRLLNGDCELSNLMALDDC